MTSAGTLSSLISFDGTNDGGSFFGLVPASDGSFYETCYDAGTNVDSVGNALGTVIRLAPNGVAATLFAFNGTNGALPRGLIQAVGGAGYTGTLFGGEGAGQGTVFKLTPAGSLTTLVAFTNNELPFGGLLHASDGNLYGMTRNGGTYGAGTIFRLSVPMPAVLKAVTQTSGILTATWNVVEGQAYQPQFCTDLSQINWTNLGPSVTATNGTMSISDAIGPDPRRFYRLALLP
jgi:uncharacterized repeat protein (TIGR03803 family)